MTVRINKPAINLRETLSDLERDEGLRGLQILAADTAAEAVEALDLEDHTFDINGGTIDGTVIGGTTPAAISGTTGTFSGDLTVDTDTLYVDSANNRVGIGTSSPSALLSVAGKIAIDGSSDRTFEINNGIGAERFTINNVAATGATVINQAIQDLSFEMGGSERMRIDSTGRVGIGTSSPASPLTVKSNASAIGMGILCRTSNDFGFLQFKSTDDAETIAEISVNRTATNTGVLRFSTNNGGSSAERMRIDSSGNVGIGTSSPAVDLHVDGGTSGPELRLQASSFSSNLAAFKLDTSGTRVVASSSNTWPFAIDTNGSEAMRIDSSGRVGIGTDSPSYELHVADTDSFAVIAIQAANTQPSHLFFGDTDDVGVGRITYDHDLDAMFFRVNASEAMRIDSSGNLLVGKSTPSLNNVGFQAFSSGVTGLVADGTVALNVNRQNTDGDSVRFYRGTSSTVGSLVGSISVTTSATAYNTSSDHRLKENITDAQEASAVIDGIQVRQFNWKADGEHQRYGMIAQELDTVAPEAVTKGETEDDMWAVDYSKLVPMLIKEIQDLRKRVAELEQ